MSSFTSPLVTKKLEGCFSEGGLQLYELTEGFSYDVSVKGKDTTIHVPIGFKTDFASTPKWSHRFLPPDGPWRKAAVIHDYMYSTGFDRHTADTIFKEALLSSKINPATAWVFYLAVRVCGWLYYQPKIAEYKKHQSTNI